MNAIKRRRVVARIMGAENKSEAIIAEARRAGVSTRTIERWMEAAKAAADRVGQSGPSGNDAPPPKEPERTVADRLLDGSGGTSEDPNKPIGPGDIHQAAVDAEQFCVEAYSGARSAVGGFLVAWKYTPPLDATSPEVIKLLACSKAAELVLRANAPRLYPILTKYASNWGALIFALGADAIGMVLALEGLAKSRGWKPQPKRAEDRPQPVEVPTAAAYGAQLRTPPPSPATNPQEEKARATIIDAPLPSEVQTETAKNVMEVLRG